MTNSKPHEGGPSPWGTIDSVHEVAEGLMWAGTPRHGGLWVSRERMAEMPDALRGITSQYTTTLPDGGRWYEEEHDAAVPMCAWPELMGAHAAWLARPLVKGLLGDAWAGAWAERVDEVADAWEVEHAAWWDLLYAGTVRDGWRTVYRQVGTGCTAMRLCTEYPQPGVVKHLPGVPVLQGLPETVN